MSKPVRVALGVMMLVAVATASGRSAEPATANVMTYDGADGQRYFAMSVQAGQVPTGQSTPLAARRDVLVLVDTSASQTGAYRTDGLEAAGAIVAGLTAQDRVQVAAIDLQLVPVTSQWSAPAPALTQQAISQLNARTPLGATDLVGGLKAAMALFSGDDSVARHVIYLGDGISQADLPSKAQFAQIVELLTAHKITVSSYAIGPQRDLRMLVALANQTGGQVFVDASDVTGQQAAESLLTALASNVIWLEATGLEAVGTRRYPAQVPPLRQDRDSIVIGTLPIDATNAQPMPATLNLRGSVRGQAIELTCQVTVQEPSEDYSFLPQLIEIAQEDDGLSLPTISSDALREIRRLLLAEVTDFFRVGAVAVTTSASAETMLVQTEAPLRLVPDEPLPAGAQEEFLGDGVTEQSSGLLEQAAETRRLNTEFIKSEVARGLDQARKVMRAEPNNTIVELKALREAVKTAPDLDAEVRNQLLDRVDTALRTANNLKVEKDHQDQMQRESQAQALERQRLLDLAQRKDQLIATYIEQFNSRMDERRYDLATDAAERAFDVEPYMVATMAAVTKGELATSYLEIMETRALRQQAVLDTLYSVETSMMPFNDNEPLVYPDAQTWENLSNSRKKYAQVDFATTNKAEEKIMEELDRPTKIDFFDESLSDAMSYLEQYHGIQIEVNQAALDDVGVTTDTTINKQLSGITLRSALKLMLRDLGLTYVVEDEVLQITTPDDAATQTVTKVYPVADLVLPIQSMAGGGMGMMGGMGGGMMGGMGGGMGGGMMGGGMGGGMMGGGMGGMGGGMGGMGMGGMGMGGFFAVEDAVSLPAAKAKKAAPARPARAAAAAPAATEPVAPATEPVAPAKAARPRAIQLQPAAGQSMAEAWAEFFGQPAEAINEADVRETLRAAMNAREFARVSEILNAALLQGYARPWMYEALSLAMLAQEAPAAEVERAIMSAVDLTGDPEEIMMAAVYMSRHGFERRALQLFREVSDVYPLRPEPLVRGLELAARLNDVEAIQWATTSVLSQAWQNDQQRIQDKAIRVAQATLTKLATDSPSEAAEFRSNLEKALARDCEITVTWTGDADIDVMVEEPTGTVCSLQNPRTLSGGVLLGDTASGSVADQSGMLSETYVCPQGFNGQYRVLVRRIWGEVTAGKVTVDLYLHRNTPQEKHVRQQISLDDKDALVVFGMDEGRRMASLQERQIAGVVSAQAAASRAILAQQLNTVSESEAVTNLAIARSRLAQGNRPFFPFRNGAVGYQPQITQLPEGTNMFATAVISADRRYVRFTGLPFFSGIGEVQTFNFFTGNTGNAGGGTAAGGVGGVGGVGGIGGGF